MAISTRRSPPYEKVRSIEDFEPWLTRVMHFPEEVLDRALRRIPPEWIAGEEDALEAMLERLLARRKRLPELMKSCRAGTACPFPRWVKD